MHQVRVNSPGGVISARVVVNGKMVPIYADKDGGYFIEGIPGASYAIEVDNLTPARVEVLSSIDGRNTLKDEELSLTASHGLVIHGYGSYRFAVWRTSNEGGRDFVFGTDLADSVVAQAGGATENAGVIGLAAWREKKTAYTPPPAVPYYTKSSPVFDSYRGPGGQSVSSVAYRGLSSANSSAPVASASAGLESDMSTGIGAYKQDRVGTTSFTRGEGPDVLVIRYASREALVAAGIIDPRLPDPFPGGEQAGGYGSYASPRS